MTEGYGVEAWCTNSLNTTRLVRGAGVVAQALYRRLTTPRGTLQGLTDDSEEAAYGFDVVGYVGANGTAASLAALPALVRGECLKDDRVSDVTVVSSISENAAGEVAILLEIVAVLSDSGETFSLTLSVSAASAELLRVST